MTSTKNYLLSANRSSYRCGGAGSAEGLSLVLGFPFGGYMLADARGALEVRLPSSPARLSQDSNILSRNLIDILQRWRYLYEARGEQCLATIRVLALYCRGHKPDGRSPS
jgi:hypothetical protein